MEEEEQKISFVTNFKEWDRVYSPGQKTPEQIYSSGAVLKNGEAGPTARSAAGPSWE
jgi:hypothetical protein